MDCQDLLQRYFTKFNGDAILAGASPVLQPRSAFGHSGGGVTAVLSLLYTIPLSETHKGNLTLP